MRSFGERNWQQIHSNFANHPTLHNCTKAQIQNKWKMLTRKETKVATLLSSNETLCPTLISSMSQKDIFPSQSLIRTNSFTSEVPSSRLSSRSNSFPMDNPPHSTSRRENQISIERGGDVMVKPTNRLLDPYLRKIVCNLFN
jgi:hypothetical protein